MAPCCTEQFAAFSRRRWLPTIPAFGDWAKTEEETRVAFYFEVLGLLCWSLRQTLALVRAVGGGEAANYCTLTFEKINRPSNRRDVLKINTLTDELLHKFGVRLLRTLQCRVLRVMINITHIILVRVCSQYDP